MTQPGTPSGDTGTVETGQSSAYCAREGDELTQVTVIRLERQRPARAPGLEQHSIAVDRLPVHRHPEQQARRPGTSAGRIRRSSSSTSSAASATVSARAASRPARRCGGPASSIPGHQAQYAGPVAVHDQGGGRCSGHFGDMCCQGLSVGPCSFYIKNG
jgi:hypothetical protein